MKPASGAWTERRIAASRATSPRRRAKSQAIQKPAPVKSMNFFTTIAASATTPPDVPPVEGAEAVDYRARRRRDAGPAPRRRLAQRRIRVSRNGTAVQLVEGRGTELGRASQPVRPCPQRHEPGPRSSPLEAAG